MKRLRVQDCVVCGKPNPEGKQRQPVCSDKCRRLYKQDCSRAVYRRYAGHYQRTAIVARYGFKCAYCGIPITVDGCNIDHVKPYKYGGKSRTKNLVPACPDCNKAKGNKSLFVFATQSGGVAAPKLQKKLARIKGYQQTLSGQQATSVLSSKY